MTKSTPRTGRRRSAVIVTAIAAAIALIGPTTAASAASPDAATVTAASPAVSASAGAAAAAPVASASTSATGQYEYVCVYADGSSVSLPAGSIADCTGATYLQKYLDGRQLETVSLTTAGEPATASIGCTIAVARGVIAAVISPVSGAIAVISTVGLNAAGLNPCD